MHTPHAGAAAQAASHGRGVLLSTSLIWQALLSKLHSAATLSAAVDDALFLVDAATAAQSLLGSTPNFVRLFSAALQARPSDCLPLLQLAANGTVPLPLLESCLGQLEARLGYLLDLVTAHLSANRQYARPPDGPDMATATQQLTTLAAALDRAPLLELARARLSLREWLREHLEAKLHKDVGATLFDSAGGLRPPRDALARLLDEG